MSEKDIVLKKYLSDNEKFSDLINGIAFGGNNIIDTKMIEEKNTVLAYHKTDKVLKRERDIIKKIHGQSHDIYIACENQIEIHYGMPIRTSLYDSLTYDEQLQELKQKHRQNKDLKNSAEFLSGIKENDKFMAVITFICYYGNEEWNSNLSLKDMIQIPEKYKNLESFLSDHQLNVIPMMKINPNLFHSELRELIALLQCNSDIQKIQTLIQSNTRYRYLSEETFEVFMVLSDERASIKQLKKYVAYNQNGKVAYDMCRAFDQLREEGRQQGRLEGRQQAEHKLNQLYATLVAQKRFDDLEKATSDEKFRQELYQEIQLSY